MTYDKIIKTDLVIFDFSYLHYKAKKISFSPLPQKPERSTKSYNIWKHPSTHRYGRTDIVLVTFSDMFP